MPAPPPPSDILLILAAVADVPEEIAWLSPREQTRLAHYGSASRRRQFLAGHVLARRLAASFAGGTPDEWELEVATDQRRELVHANGRRLSVSLSHSGELVAVAVSARPLGLDLEAGTAARDWPALAARLFAPATASHVIGAGDGSVADRFREAWCLHEARAKQHGEGLRRERLRHEELLHGRAGQAMALSWRVEGGWLALAGWPGMRVAFSDGSAGPTGPARSWDYAGPAPA